ncbi:UvrD-helicase domain-containing protein [Paenibacillus sp. FSL R5-0473]|uniref:UvrD-helicase domain-containing protein n=1 Tax=Paenibacillus sp. FSL R5-0473 TaxID=2921642 RepID=UPI0030F936A6
MAGSIVENIYLVNAPAGSGKTTKIKSMIFNHTIEHPKDNILCITFTNRAADELKKDTKNSKVYFSTIHSFFNSFIGIYFSHPQVIEIYFEIYGEDIKQRIDNVEEDVNIYRSNQKYIDKFGSLNFESIQKNLRYLYYNEAQFNSLYYGGLSHDDLIKFTKIIFDTFPVVKKRLTQKFQLIFIDEYQDSSAAVLKIFYEAVYGTSTKLYFLGDKMQQIYKNYDGTFEDKLSILNKSIALTTNHRSISQVLNILNKLYNNDSFKQEPSPNNLDGLSDHPPRVIICDQIFDRLDIEKMKYPEALLLFLLNQKRFDSIGCGNLYRGFNKMEIYSFVQQNRAIDVLTDQTSDNPDPLIKMLFAVHQISEYYADGNLGTIIQLLRKNSKMFDKSTYVVLKHEDKNRLKDNLDLILGLYNDSEDIYDIKSIVSILKSTGLAREDFIDAILNSEEYSSVLEVGVSEFKTLVNYLKTPNVSTQHGVKGESHETVFFIAENSSSTPVVHMYQFFNLWCKVDISLDYFESFYYEYVEFISNINQHLGFKISNINKELHEEYQNYLVERARELIDAFKDNLIFKTLCEKSYTDYLSNLNVTTVKRCFKENQVYGVLSAYRLFYVGCSRARRNLTVFIDKSKIDGFSTQLIEKFRTVGFNIEE